MRVRGGVATRLAFYLAGLLAPCVWANTEIVNFDVSRGLAHEVEVLSAFPQTSSWPKLSPSSPEQLFSVVPAPLGTATADVCLPAAPASLEEPSSSHTTCPHELWLVLGTDEPAWTSYSRFTLRVSWPASSPTDFSIDTFSPASLRKLTNLTHAHAATSTLTSTSNSNSNAYPSSTRSQPGFARIRLVDTGVRAPSPRHRASAPDPVRFIVTVEPLYLGVLPPSVLPTVLALLVVSAVAVIFVVPPVTARLSAVADRVRAAEEEQARSKAGLQSESQSQSQSEPQLGRPKRRQKDE